MMNRNGIIAAVAILGFLAFAAWSLFEIYPVTKNLPPSLEARRNEYLALDRWIASNGCAVRVENSGDYSTVSRSGFKQIFIQTSRFSWSEEAVSFFIDWIENGGTLFLTVDSHEESAAYFSHGFPDWEEDWIWVLLEEFGITVNLRPAWRNLPSDMFSEPWKAPDYDRSIAFNLLDEDSVSAMIFKSPNGYTRLIEAHRGKGKLIVSGKPVFLYSSNIEDEPNARLASAFFLIPNEGPAAVDEGWLFIRGTTRITGILGSLWKNGNLPVLLVSVAVLLIICFWAVIPVFGLVRRAEDRPGKPLRERFLAEGRFLKRYEALGFYRDVYFKEIKQRLAKKEGLSGEDEIRKRIEEIMDKPVHEQDLMILAGILKEGQLMPRDFLKMIVMLKTILERV